MLLSPRKNGLDSLFKEVRVFKACIAILCFSTNFHGGEKNFLSGGSFVTLSAPQKTVVIYFHGFAWEFGIERRQGFVVNFQPSPFPKETKHKKSSNTSVKFRAFFGAKFGMNMRQKFGSFCSATFLT